MNVSGPVGDALWSRPVPLCCIQPAIPPLSTGPHLGQQEQRAAGAGVRVPLPQVKELGRHDGRREEAQAQEAGDCDERHVLERFGEWGLDSPCPGSRQSAPFGPAPAPPSAPPLLRLRTGFFPTPSALTQSCRQGAHLVLGAGKALAHAPEELAEGGADHRWTGANRAAERAQQRP